MAEKYDFSGVWRSTYHKADESKVPDTEHYVTMRLIGNQLVIESIPSPTGSYLLARFTLDDRVLTGSYQSQNSPHNAAKGAIYYGAAQLVLDPDGKAMRGQGVGFGKDMKVKATLWKLVRVGQHPDDKNKK
jgi:hypothetical protein